ncbi:MAG: MBOAT family protein [Oscillospiraceae bacterium]|nr:MBOAT family protein [Oscillospiraceae bacterium]
MNFNSGAFLIFLPVVTAGYWLLPYRFRKYWLLAASYYFYMYWNPWLIFPFLLSTAVDYCCGLGIEKYRGNKPVMKALLLTSICLNLTLLFSFKYLDFFGETVNQIFAMLSLPLRIPKFGLILPVGISFYTFQTMSYTIDVYRGDFHAERDPVTFALYVSYFPQLVAGPIENPGNLLPQLRREQKLNWEDLTAGGRLLISGYFRKCVVADLCGIYVNRVFAHMDQANSLTIMLAGALFCIQMYCDFAGYSEIAAGAARLMGVRLMRNFDRPYLSQSYTEFFRRWHISLNRWFTQYVYIPLGGSRRGKVRKIMNIFVVFTLCGLWHGANWTYVLWGIYAAFWLCLESLTLKPMEQAAAAHKIDLKHPVVKLLRRGTTFLIFIPAALLFRAVSVEQLGVIFPRLVSQWGFGHEYLQSTLQALGLDAEQILRLVLCIVAMAGLHRWGQYDLPRPETNHQMARSVSAAVYYILIIALCWLALLATQDVAGFAYFRF